MSFFKKYLEINEKYWFFWHFFIHFFHCWNWLLFQWLTSIWAFSNRIFQWNFHYFSQKKDSFFVKIDDYVSFWELIIVYWLWILEKSFYGFPSIIFEKSIFMTKIKSKNEKHYLFFKPNYLLSNDSMKKNGISHFASKLHFAH